MKINLSNCNVRYLGKWGNYVDNNNKVLLVLLMEIQCILIVYENSV